MVKEFIKVNFSTINQMEEVYSFLKVECVLKDAVRITRFKDMEEWLNQMGTSMLDGI